MLIPGELAFADVISSSPLFTFETAGAAGEDAGKKVHEEASLGGFVISGFKFGGNEGAAAKDEL